MARDYSKGKIYELKCLITGKRYMGSTTKQYLSQRLVAHKADYGNWLNGKKDYFTAIEILKGGSYQITLVETYACQSKNELEARERHWIQKLECVNKVIPTRTKAEYREDNRDVLRAAARAYQTERRKDDDFNKAYLAYRRTRVTCPDCGQEMARGSISRHKRSKSHLERVATSHGQSTARGADSLPTDRPEPDLADTSL